MKEKDDKETPVLKMVHFNKKKHKLRHCALEMPNHMLFKMVVSEDPGGRDIAFFEMKFMDSDEYDMRFKKIAEFTSMLFEDCEIVFDEGVKPDPDKTIA